ncbi:sulfotransferase family 2 domain-containing protein [Prochlorothrix hollandica]|uniref:Sulfotransferase n=1 Tax=Prochlorothrix hollandica PCC 9006 = CALU 1027 TaxID=317619 RepID=A0A0M2PTD2_PROHO|nr:sulfotransferase family 2 domain-containing protein [Prochlorothrix hollandica]KKI98407.1 sulfotransferase [Prochlorothrix hollandica PCC 9006 = CALU 1027]
MLISYSHQFIFFHVTKAAGTSMKEALKPYAQEPEQFKIKRPPQTIEGRANTFYEMWESMLWHAKARDARKELPPDVYNGFYKFAFVRNPWDWQVSYYHFILKETTHIRHESVKAMAGGFEEYLEWVIATKNPFPKGATKLQKEIIADREGQLIVDFIGRYETLVPDFQTICETLGLTAQLPRLNVSRQGRDYRAYYSDRTRQLVADHFGDDIETFGYTFEGYRADVPLGRLTAPPIASC